MLSSLEGRNVRYLRASDCCSMPSKRLRRYSIGFLLRRILLDQPFQSPRISLSFNAQRRTSRNWNKGRLSSTIVLRIASCHVVFFLGTAKLGLTSRITSTTCDVASLISISNESTHTHSPIWGTGGISLLFKEVVSNIICAAFSSSFSPSEPCGISRAWFSRDGVSGSGAFSSTP